MNGDATPLTTCACATAGARDSAAATAKRRKPHWLIFLMTRILFVILKGAKHPTSAPSDAAAIFSKKE
jgi:hypothetical protein